MTQVIRLEEGTCQFCGKPLTEEQIKRNGQYCSHSCSNTVVSRSSAALRGEMQRGRKYSDEGARYIRTSKGEMYHRVVWEKEMGPLLPGQVLDHIDHNRHNNDITNLRVFNSHGQHMKYHWKVSGKEWTANIKAAKQAKKLARQQSEMAAD